MKSLEVTVRVSRMKAWGPLEFRAPRVLRVYEQQVYANLWTRWSLGILTKEMDICPLQMGMGNPPLTSSLRQGLMLFTAALPLTPGYLHGFSCLYPLPLSRWYLLWSLWLLCYARALPLEILLNPRLRSANWDPRAHFSAGRGRGGIFRLHSSKR